MSFDAVLTAGAVSFIAISGLRSGFGDLTGGSSCTATFAGAVSFTGVSFHWMLAELLTGSMSLAIGLWAAASAVARLKRSRLAAAISRSRATALASSLAIVTGAGMGATAAAGTSAVAVFTTGLT